MKTYDSFEINSSAKYKNICKVVFHPVTEVKLVKVCSKGERRYWKWLGFIPLIPYTMKEDLYKRNGNHYTYTLKEIADFRFYRFIRDNRVFEKAKVEIHFAINNNIEYEYFDSNEKATKFIDSLKERCKEVGNELK